MATTIRLDKKTIKPYLNGDDVDVVEFINDCLASFKNYGQIVLRFNDKKATWNNPNVKEIADIPCSDIGNAILELYVEELLDILI